MTTYTTTRTSRPVTQRAAGHTTNRDHIVTGTPAQLANIVANHRTAGTLVAVTAPRPVDTDRFQVVIRLRDNQHTAPDIRVTSVGQHTRTYTRRPWHIRLAVIATAITAATAGLIAAAAYLIGQLVELIVTHAGLILGVLTMAAILAAIATRPGAGRRHCPGC